MTLESTDSTRVAYVSIGIFAWNEESAIGAALDSLFAQSLFKELGERNLACEVICVGNGCTDRTAEIASTCFERQARLHPERQAFSCEVASLPERGKLNAWNKFVHVLSGKRAKFLILMDADILIHRETTLWNMVRALEENVEASVSVDRPCKDILFKKNKSLRDRLSLAAGQIASSGSPQLCAQLYCIRSEVARNIYLPKDLAACEDGFIKSLVCTDFLRHEVRPERMCLAPGAEHIFEAYTSPGSIFKNQKRQIIGQTIVHLLVDNHLKSLTPDERQWLAATLSEKEADDPFWLRRLINEHLRRTRYFWRLYPGLLSHRFRSWRNLAPARRLACFPATAAGFLVTLISSFMARSFLKAGATDYWPKAKRLGFNSSGPGLERVTGDRSN